MLPTQFAAFALATTALLLASGCGSSKTGSQTASTATPSTAASSTATSSISTTPVTLAAGKPLTRAQLIAQGDAICATTTRKLMTISPRTNAEVVRALPQVAIYLGSEAEDLSRLVPSASMTHDWTLIVNDIHFIGEYESRAYQYFQEKQQQAGGHLYTQANKLNVQWKEAAKRAGFKQCSEFR